MKEQGLNNICKDITAKYVHPTCLDFLMEVPGNTNTMCFQGFLLKVIHNKRFVHCC